MTYNKFVEWFLEQAVETPTKCWNWPHGTTSRNYGQVVYQGKLITTHKLSYMLFVGEIENGLYVLHTCDNTICFNPRHLYLGTQFDNMNDRSVRGRWQGLHGQDNGRFILTDTKIQQILALHNAGKSYRQIASIVEVSRSTICNLLKSNK
jgi:hypothetical protein